MRYDVRTEVEGTRIVSTVDLVSGELGDPLGEDIRTTIIRQVIDTQDAQVRAALEKLGWHAPGSIAAIDMPCAPSGWTSMSRRATRRVTIDDIRKMEQRLSDIRRLVND